MILKFSEEKDELYSLIDSTDYYNEYVSILDLRCSFLLLIMYQVASFCKFIKKEPILEDSDYNDLCQDLLTMKESLPKNYSKNFSLEDLESNNCKLEVFTSKDDDDFEPDKHYFVNVEKLLRDMQDRILISGDVVVLEET